MPRTLRTALCALALLAIGAASRAEYRVTEGRVIALGSDTALVTSGWPVDLQLFSLETGELIHTMQWPFIVGDAQFDGEFWGGATKSERGILWRWRLGDAEPATAATPCRMVFGVFAGPHGERYFVCSPTGQITDRAVLGRWERSGELSMVGELPAPWPNGPAQYYEGWEAPFANAGAYVVDVCGGKPALVHATGLPTLPSGEIWAECRYECGGWMVGAEDMSSFWVSANDGGSWLPVSTIPRCRDDIVVNLTADVTDARTVYALVRREAEPMRFELWMTPDLGATWGLRGPLPSDAVCLWDVSTWTVGLRPFPVKAGVWVQLTHAVTGGEDWTLEFVFYPSSGGAGRSVRFRGRQ